MATRKRTFTKTPSSPNVQYSRGNDNFMGKLETMLDLYLVDKAPSLPENWKEILVKILPYLIIVFFILSLPLVLVALGLSALIVPLGFVAGVGSGVGITLSIVILAVSLVLEAMAIPGLFARSKSGWRLLYYSTLVSALYSIVTMSLSGLVLGTLVSLYILFQIKSHYK